MSAPFTHHGKQVLTSTGHHYADAADPKAAEFIADACNAKAGQGWRDISTAPRDGTQILVGVWVAGHYPGSDTRWSSWTIGVRGTGGFGCDGEWGDEPTHWQPLPTPPTQVKQ